MDRLTGLQMFVRVVETRSFSRAASELGLTQPTVTKHVSAIEQQFAVRLLNRNSRGVSLTEVGLLYYERCKVVLQELETAESIVGQNRSGMKGLLRIGTSMAFGQLVLAPLVLEFAKTHPGLRVDFNCDDRFVDLVGHGLDVAIRLGRLSDSSLGCKYLGTNRWTMVAADSYLTAHGTPTRVEELSDHQCLVYSTVQGGDVWRVRPVGREQMAIHVNGKIKSNNLSILLTAVRDGLGIAILPHYAAAASIKSGDVKVIMSDYVLPDQEINAIFPSARYVPPKVSLLMSHLRSHFKDQWWRDSPG